MDVDIPSPNRAISAYLLSARNRAILFEITQNAQFLIQSRIPHVTGQLAATVRGFTEIGGVRHDRWIGKVVMGTGLEYGAAEEYGHLQGKIGRPERPFVLGAHDFNAVLEELAAL